MIVETAPCPVVCRVCNSTYILKVLPIWVEFYLNAKISTCSEECATVARMQWTISESMRRTRA